MKTTADNLERGDQIIAGLLWYGTWFASALVAAGIFLTAVEPLQTFLALPLTGYDTVKAGVAVFILLPVARVALMLTIFLLERDYAHTIIAALVLAIISAGIIIEM
jgi:hypothetical protein